MKKTILIIAAVVLAFALAACSSKKDEQSRQKYEQGIDAMNKGEYKAAMDIFSAIPDYENSGQLYTLAKDALIKDIENAVEAGEYERAEGLISGADGLINDPMLAEKISVAKLENTIKQYIFETIHGAMYLEPATIMIEKAVYVAKGNGDVFTEHYLSDGVVYIELHGKNGFIERRIILIGGENDKENYLLSDENVDFEAKGPALDAGAINDYIAQEWTKTE